MRRASGSDRVPYQTDDMRPRSRFSARGIPACALAVALTVGAPAASPATADTDDDEGRLSLNTNVLINESVGTGTPGDFAIRGRLFSEDLAARARAQREASANRLGVVDTLTFAPSEVDPGGYRAVRAALFDDYSTGILSEAREAHTECPFLSALVLVIGAPLVLLAGLGLGRLWARRRRASA